MVKRSNLLVAGSLLVLGFGLSCSSKDDGDTEGGGGSGASGPDQTSTTDDGRRDADGDGDFDPIEAEDWGEGAVPISEEDVDAMHDEACTGWVAEPEPLGATLFMVVDASSSMNMAPPEGGPLTKWEVTRDAIIEAIEMFSDDTALGFLAYPNKVVDGTAGDPAMCVNMNGVVPLGLLGQDNHRQVVIDALNAVQTNQCTPTLEAYRAGLADFAATPAAGQKYMLLMTDGTPTLGENCSPGTCGASLEGSEQPVIDLVASAYRDQNIKTFILGCPGSEVHSVTGLDNRWWLSQAAEAGGTAGLNCSHDAEPYCHFDMTGPGVNFGDMLRNSLQDIVGQVVSCEYSMPTPPPGESLDLNMINLVIRPDGADPVLLIRKQDADCTEGWFLNTTTQQVQFCSDSCALVQSDPLAQAELLFGCASYVEVPQ